MPEGSFWVSRSTVDRMLAGQDSFAVGSVQGFGWRDLHNGNWLMPVPVETLSLSKPAQAPSLTLAY
jgi:hypothetical protein